MLLTVSVAFLWGLCTSLAWAAGQGPRAAGNPLAGVGNRSGRILIGLQPGLAADELGPRLATQGFILERHWPEFGLVAVRPVDTDVRQADAQALQAVLARARAVPGARYAEVDGIVEAALSSRSGPSRAGQGPLVVPNDPLYPQQYALSLIGMPAAWNVTLGDPELVVALIDSGYDISHEDLDAASLWWNEAERNGAPGVDDDGNGYVDDLHGWDWVQNDNTFEDPFGHGTHVGGTLAATTDNGIGIAAAGRRLQVMPLRVLDEQGVGFISDLIDALAYARAHGARIINLSLILRFDSLAVHDAIRAVHADGGLIVAATGNYGSRVYWPAAYTETVAVAAVNRTDEVASFSNAGPETDVAAPGVGVLSTYRDNSYFANDGTSMAVPHVSALASLLWSVRPDMGPAEIVALMRDTAADVNRDTLPGPDEAIGAGRIDAAAALLRATEGVSLAVDFTENVFIAVEQPLAFPVRLSVPDAERGDWPVVGGLVHYQLRGPTGVGVGSTQGVLVMSGTLTSDIDGRARLDFTAPSQAGQYDLTFQFGRQRQDLSFLLQDGPLVLSARAAQSSIPAGVGETALYVNARFGSGGAPLADPLPVVLETSLGTFSNGEQQRALLMTGGWLTETLHAGTVAGSANITVTAAGQTQRMFVTVHPGPVYRVEGPETLYVQVVGKGADVPVNLRVTDRYGNPIWSGVQVNFYTAEGNFSPASVEVQMGEAVSALTLASTSLQPVRIWAVIPGSFVTYSSRVYLLGHHRYLPWVFAPRASGGE